MLVEYYTYMYVYFTCMYSNSLVGILR